MAESYEALRERYTDSIWLRSEITYIIGPIRNNFDSYIDPHDRSSLLSPRSDQFKVTLTTASSKHYSITTYGEVSVAMFDTGENLLIFQTIFGDSLANFAVVTPSISYNEPHKQKAINSGDKRYLTQWEPWRKA